MRYTCLFVLLATAAVSLQSMEQAIQAWATAPDDVEQKVATDASACNLQAIENKKEHIKARQDRDRQMAYSRYSQQIAIPTYVEVIFDASRYYIACYTNNILISPENILAMFLNDRTCV